MIGVVHRLIGFSRGLVDGACSILADRFTSWSRL